MNRILQRTFANVERNDQTDNNRYIFEITNITETNNNTILKLNVLHQTQPRPFHVLLIDCKLSTIV